MQLYYHIVDNLRSEKCRPTYLTEGLLAEYFLIVQVFQAWILSPIFCKNCFNELEVEDMAAF